MIKAVVYDADGMVIDGARFSVQYAKEFNIPLEEMTPFFTEVFPSCILGKADLKKALIEGDWLARWKWQSGVEELLGYWFNCGDHVEKKMLESIDFLRAKGGFCVLATNQEKYRLAHLRTELEFSKHFEQIFASCEMGYKKPHSKFFEAIYDYLHSRDKTIKSREILFWDDKPDSVKAGSEFGFEARPYLTYENYRVEMGKLGLF